MPGNDASIRREDEIIDRVGWVVMLVVPGEEQTILTASYAYTVGSLRTTFPNCSSPG